MMPVSPTFSARSSQSSTQSAILSSPSPSRSKVPAKRKVSRVEMPSKELQEDLSSAPPPPKKKAGRKKATQDGDAVERRRTQLRLAQRAYRERKESTIAELEKKSAGLERALSEVYGIFSEYQSAVSSGRTASRDSRWVQELASVRQRLDSAVQAVGMNIEMPSGTISSDTPSAIPITADDADSIGSIGPKTRLNSGLGLQPADMLGYQFDSDPTASSFLSMHNIPQHQQSQRLQQTQQQHHFHPQSLDQTTQANPSPPMSIGDSHSSFNADDLTRTTKTGIATTARTDTDDSTDPTEESVDEISVIDINPQTSPSLDTVISSDWLNSLELGGAVGYKNETVTFARRLFHYCMEQCYRMMTDPSYDPAKVARKMRFSFLFFHKDDILGSLRSYLQLNRKSPRHTPEPGFIPWGNAGCHYPRPALTQDWSKEFRVVEEEFDASEAENLRAQALFKYSAIEQSRFPKDAFTYMPDEISSNQAWFDSYDTEAYLRQRGVQFDYVAASASIEIEVDETPSFVTSYSSAAATISGITSSNTAEELDFTGFGDWQLPDMDSVPDLAWSPQSSDTGEVGSFGINPDAGAAAMSDINTADNGLFNIWDLDLDLQQPASFMGTVGDELGMAGLDKTLFPPLPDSNLGIGISPTAAASPAHETAHQSKVKKTVIVDVDRLIALLEDGAICLGKSPGFGKSVVDDALQRVIQEAW